MSLIYIVGMPGAGKTYYGSQAAHVLNVPFIDLDSYIEEQQQNAIANIFEMQGEEGFREIERDALRMLIEANKGKDLILACGGGTPAYQDNMDVMKQNGHTIYLKCSIEQLIENINKQHSDRPLLRDGDIDTKLRSILAQREEYYIQAHYTVNMDEHSLQSLVTIIQQCIDQH